MGNYELTGGGRVGGSHATFPFVTLRVNYYFLELSLSAGRKYLFLPQDIISIEPIKSIPLIGQGIRINHRVTAYSEDVVFWTFENPHLVINKINQTGLFENTENKITEHILTTIRAEQNSDKSVFKKQVVYGVILLINVAFFADIIFQNINYRNGFGFGFFMMLAVCAIFFGSILVLCSKKIAARILVEGKTSKDMNKYLYRCLLFCILGFFFIVLTNASRNH